jgi:hypothetical protein
MLSIHPWRAQSCVLSMVVGCSAPPALRMVNATLVPSLLQDGKFSQAPGGTPLTTVCCSGGTGMVVSSVTAIEQRKALFSFSYHAGSFRDAAIVGSCTPQQEAVVMLHGTFDQRQAGVV